MPGAKNNNKIAPQSVKVPDEFDDDKALPEIKLSESTMAEITAKLGPVPWGTTVQVQRKNNNVIELRGIKEPTKALNPGQELTTQFWSDALFDGVLFDKEDLKAQVKACPPPAQMVMQSSGVALSYSGPEGFRKYHKDGDFSSEDLDDGAIEFKGSGGTVTYKIPGKKMCGCLSQQPILEVLKDGELVGQLVPGPRPKPCVDREKILMRVIDKDKKELYTLRVPIGGKGPCGLPCCEIKCEYEDTPSRVAQWLGPSLRFKSFEFAEYLSVPHDVEGKQANFGVVGHVGTSDRTHTYWTPKAGLVAQKDAWGDLSTPVDEPEAIAWSLVPFQEMLEASFTEDTWEANSSKYTMKSQMYKGRRARPAPFSK